MIIISHRGNISGPDKELENNPAHIARLSKTHNVEVDLWATKSGLFLGHDGKQHPILSSFLNKNLWVHCKNLDAVNFMHNTELNWFWHENDKVTITSKGYIWCYPGVFLPDGITVMAKKGMPRHKVKGICTDFLLSYA